MAQFGYSCKKFIVICSISVTMSWFANAQDTSDLWCQLTSKTISGSTFPAIPSSLYTRIELNVMSHGFSSVILRKVDRLKKRDYFEVQSGSRHVLYLSSKEDDTFLTINYGVEGPVCKTQKLSQTSKSTVFDEKDAGPQGILQILEEEIFPKTDKFQALDGKFQVRGVPVQCWQTCQYSKQLGAAVRVTAYFSSMNDKSNELVRLQVEAKDIPEYHTNIEIFEDFFDNRYTILEDKDFQIPEMVHCPNYQIKKKDIPLLPNYFTYASEITRYAHPSGLDAVVNLRTVHYDYKGSISRVEYHGNGKSTEDFDPIDTKIRSFIFDYNSGLQYAFDPLFGACSITPLDSSLDVFDKFDSDTMEMLAPKAFFYVNDNENNSFSYNGIYETRGLQADVFSRKDPEKGRILFWYFTADRTKLVQEMSVEKNILVKIISRPETGSSGSEGRIDLNIYNFIQQESKPFIFDISSCYNESFTKEYILTFTGGSMRYRDEVIYLFKMRLQQKICEVVGVSSQRVIIQQIEFQDTDILTQFKILDQSPIQGGKPRPNENDLETAVELLKKSLNNGEFEIELSVSKDKVIMLRPEPDGLKEFKPDRPVYEGEIFHESSFVGMSIGMAVLGFLLGGIVVNLVFTRKYGISLLQISDSSSAPKGLESPLDESSI